MANDNHIKTFTAGDIEKYHRGQLSAKEMHAMEKASLDDPFLADALEGYATPGINISADIAELKKRLSDKTEQTKVIPIGSATSYSFPWLRAAVMVVVIAGAALLSYQFLFKTKTDDIAQAVQKENEIVKTADTSKQISLTNGSDSSSVSATTVSTPATQTPGTAITPTQEIKSRIEANGNAGEFLSADSVTRTDDHRVADKSQPVTTSPSKKEEEKNSEYKALAKDVAATESETIVADDKYRKPLVKQQNTDKDAVTARKEKAIAAPGVANNNRVQGLYQSTNFFRGRVTDGYNNALPFANITNTTDNVGTYTDAKGYFTLVSPDSVLNVQVRSLGFENNITRLRNNVATNQVVLQDDRSLSELVVSNKKVNSNRSRDTMMKFEEPEPADGWESYDTYIVNNLNIAETEVKKPGSGGQVEISFEVNKDGEPINIRIEKSLCDKCDKEAIRLIKEGPKWKRKAKKGKRTTVTVPFN